MILHKTIPMEFEEKQYEIRVYHDDISINVVAFRDNRPANGFRHIVRIPKRVDIKQLLDKHRPDELIEACKSDITEKRWETFSKVIG
ncbi:MAG: hypothetical protein GY839_04840 [candidate division Zixibacteria bacterium]|nr:hypothetical protein [candidate division Zixibacteria bacterium]